MGAIEGHAVLEAGAGSLTRAVIFRSNRAPHLKSRNNCGYSEKYMREGEE